MATLRDALRSAGMRRVLWAYRGFATTERAAWVALSLGLASWVVVVLAVLANCAVTLCRPAHFATLR